MLFPNPARNTVEHQLGDHSDYSLTSDDPAYPGGDITAIAVDCPRKPRASLSFFCAGRPTAAIVASPDGGKSWSRLATIPGRVLLLAPRNAAKVQT